MCIAQIFIVSRKDSLSRRVPYFAVSQNVSRHKIKRNFLRNGCEMSKKIAKIAFVPLVSLFCETAINHFVKNPTYVDPNSYPGAGKPPPLLPTDQLTSPGSCSHSGPDSYATAPGGHPASPGSYVNLRGSYMDAPESYLRLTSSCVTDSYGDGPDGRLFVLANAGLFSACGYFAGQYNYF